MNYRRKVLLSIRSSPQLLREIIQDNVKTIERLLHEDPKKCIHSDQNRRTPLHLAASLGRSKIVDLFLTKECYSVNFRDNDLVTPLHRACRNNHVETVQILLGHNADVNARTRLHVTPLHVCCSFNALDCARLIVPHVSNINVTDSNGNTALHHAVFQNNLPMIELLLEHGAQVEVQDKQGRRPIHYAAIINSPPVIQLLVKAGCDVNVRNKDLLSPLHFAIAYKHQDAFFELLACDANLEAQDINGNMPSHWAAYMGCVKIFEAIKQRVSITSPNLNGVTPLHYACSTHNGDESAVRIMDAVPDIDLVDKFQRTPLHFAAMNGRDKIASELIGRGANCNSSDVDLETPMHKATQNCHGGMIEILLKQKVHVDTANKDGYTPLHFAVIAGLPWNCEQLIKAGANPLLCDNSGRTAHFMAVYKGTFDCLLTLMTSPYYSKEKLMDTNQAVFPDLDAFHRSLLHYAAASSTCPHDFLELLLMRRPLKTISNLSAELNAAIESAFRRFDINQRDIFGRTPLHYICIRESIDMDNDIPFLVEMFLEAGADASILDNENRLPFHYAVANGYNSVLAMLFNDKLLKTPDVARSFIKCCPLKTAAYYGNSTAINHLVDYGFRNFDPAIEIATRRGHWNCVIKLKNFITSEHLFQKLAMISAYNGQVHGLRIFIGQYTSLDLEQIFFMAAASRDGAQCLDFLLEKRVNIHAKNRHGRNALFNAVLGGNFESIRLLLVSGIRLVQDTRGKTVLHLICSQGNFDMFRLIHSLAKDHGFYGHLCTFLLTKDDDGFCPIEIACLKRHQLILEYYLATINKGFEQKMMYFAGFVGNSQFIEHILKKNGATFVNLIGPFKRTLLHYCCLSKQTNLPLLKLLIEELNFDVHFMDTNDLTPLLCAACIGSAETVRYLLEETQSSILATDVDENNILHLACMSGNAKCALTVIEQAEKQGVLDELMMARNNSKQTPLHLAALKSLAKVVSELLGKGADVNDVDEFDYTPAMYCARDPTAAYCLSMMLVIIESDLKVAFGPPPPAQRMSTEADTMSQNDTSPSDDHDDSLVGNNSTLYTSVQEPSAITATSSHASLMFRNRASSLMSRASLNNSHGTDMSQVVESRLRRLSLRHSFPAVPPNASCDSSDLVRLSSKGSLKDAEAIAESAGEGNGGQKSAKQSSPKPSGKQSTPNGSVAIPTDDQNASIDPDSDSDMY